MVEVFEVKDFSKLESFDSLKHIRLLNEDDLHIISKKQDINFIFKVTKKKEIRFCCSDGIFLYRYDKKLK